MNTSSPSVGRTRFLRIAERGLWLLLSLYLFLLALSLIKCGAKDLILFFRPEGITSASSALGTGWLLACVALSGSPIAGIALGLLESGELNALGTFAMVTGSRLGASFVVLLVGFIYDLRAQERRGGVYVGALALITTATIYVPAFAVGYGILKAGLLEGMRFGPATDLHSLLDYLQIQHCVDYSGRFLKPWVQSLAGMGLMIGAFKLFDGFLPVVDPTGGKLAKFATTIYRPWITFVFGMMVTCITLSVSVSLTVLVPLTARGIVRRENMIPYIMGANITTFVDTLFLSLFLKNTSGFTVVLCEMLVVTLISVPILFLFYRPYERLVDTLARKVTQSRWRLTFFVLGIFLIPLLLTWMQ